MPTLTTRQAGTHNGRVFDLHEWPRGRGLSLAVSGARLVPQADTVDFADAGGVHARERTSVAVPVRRRHLGAAITLATLSGIFRDTLGGISRGLGRVRDAGGMLLWIYPHGPLSDLIEYAVEVEADHAGVRIMVARDAQSVPHAIAVSVGDDPADFGDALTMWGLASPDDSDEPPHEWFA